MKRSLIKTKRRWIIPIMVLCVSFLTLVSCEDTESSSGTMVNEPEVIKKEAVQQEHQKVQVEGYYEKTAHDGAWFMRLEASGDTCHGKLIQFEGMLPPQDMLEDTDGLEDVAKDMAITYFVLNADGASFTSNLGTGSIANDTITFDDVKDLDEKLVLSKRKVE